MGQDQQVMEFFNVGIVFCWLNHTKFAKNPTEIK